MSSKHILSSCLTLICWLQGTILFAQDATPKIVDPYPANVPKNYVRTWDAAAPIADPELMITRPRKEVMQTTAYIDGLGRPMQTVARQSAMVTGSSPVDLVNANIYDEYGREVRQFLPFASTETKGAFKFNPIPQQQYFYSDNNANSPINGQGETFYYGKTEFEPSPLNRTDRKYEAGNSWVNQGKGITMRYLMNTLADDVRIWNVQNVTNDFSSYSTPSGSAGIYPAGQLHKTITIDENNNQVIEFKDKLGLVILKKVQHSTTTDNGSGSGHPNWLCTYYIYDDLGNLRCVVQPRGVQLLELNGWNMNASGVDILNEQCFRYEYDQRNRVIMKKVPGAGAVQLVYDARDRLVMMQDANMYHPSKMQWFVTRYDGKNRATATYLITDPAHYNNAVYHRQQAAGSTSYPNVSSYSNELLTETYYDNYDGIPSGFSISSLYASGYASYLDAPSSDFPDPVASNLLVNGLLTWTRTKVLGENKYITSCNLYDEKKRIVQVQTINYSGGMDIVTNQYSFSGLLLRSHVRHQKNGSGPQSYDLGTKNVYDDLGRVVSIEKNLNGSGWKPIAAMTYDAIGQLKTKKLAPGYNSNQGLETLSYDYNIRGWLLGVNRSYLKNNNASGFEQHYFGFELGYDKSTTTPGTTGFGYLQYNGNMAGTIWKSKGDEVRRYYDFLYDNANRLGRANYYQYVNPGSGDSWNPHSTSFSVHGTDPANNVVGNNNYIQYDANGNILSMVHHGWTASNPNTVIDNLSYNYYNNSNRLKSVIDNSNDYSSTLGDFKYNPALKGAIDYGYDANGNLTTDLNKRIGPSASNVDPNTGLQPGGAIYYNHLNLPQVITVAGKGSIEYVYDATGNKLKKIVHETGQPDKTTLYMFGIYENDLLQFFTHEEGRIRPVRDANNNITSFTNDYFIKDHLGNVRMVLTEEQQQNVYPAATLEGSMANSNDAAFVEKQFYAIDAANVVDKSVATGVSDYQNNNGVPNNNPKSNTTALSQKLYRLKATAAANGGVTGLGITLKVMSGDSINILGSSYYFQNNTGGKNYSIPAETILSSLFGSPAGTAGSKGMALGNVNGQSELGDLVNTFLKNPGRNHEKADTRPNAYINWILFDNNFKYVTGSFDRVGRPNEVKRHALTNIPVTKNGYLYVYASNESPVNVFFDNLQVTQVSGPILEETHYYPFGLTMAGISSRIINQNYIENKKGYNGNELQNKEFSDGGGLEVYDFNARTLDPQIGRFWQIDPATDILVSYTPYESMGNNPINYVDPLGDFRRKFGALWYRFWNGGGNIGQNEFGEWYVEKTKTEAMEDGNAAIVSYKYYGEGRNQYMAAGEDIRDEQEKEESIDHMVKIGVLERHDTQQKANEANLKAFTGVLLPNVLKYATIKTNFNPMAHKSLKELQQMVGGENAKLLRKLFGVNEKGAQAVLDDIKNLEIPEGLTKETLQAYRELINRVPDPRGTQAIRAKILDKLLEKLE